MTEEEVLQLARETVLAEKWQWCEPIRVRKKFRFIFFGGVIWVVATDNRFGGNVHIQIDDQTGRVIAKGFYKS